MFIDGDFAGKSIYETMWSPYWYFDSIMSEDEYDEIFPDDTFISLTLLEIDEYYRNAGFARKLMDYTMKEMKKERVKQIYINESPIGTSGMSLSPLVKFYKKHLRKIQSLQGCINSQKLWF